MQKIAAEAEGFLYCVSSLGVTGMRTQINTNIGQLIQNVKQVSDIPCAIGFGISNPQQAAEMAKLSDGVICGSAIVKIVAEYGKRQRRAGVRFRLRNEKSGSSSKITKNTEKAVLFDSIAFLHKLAIKTDGVKTFCWHFSSYYGIILK